jgi:LuxR family maltose regulon positive regulatory protein
MVADEREFQTLPASIAGARTYWSMSLGDLAGTLKYAQRALDLWPKDNHLRRSGPAAMLGLASWSSGDLEGAHRSFSEALAGYQRSGHILLAITGTHVLADIRLAQGRLRDAVETYQQSFALVAEHGSVVQWGTADMHTRLSELHLEQNDLVVAARHLSKSKALGEQSTLPNWRWRWCLAQARLKAAQGDLDEALDLLDEAERSYIRGPVPAVRPIAALKARLWVGQGRLTQALDWAAAQGLSAGDDLSYMREFEYITLARIRIAQIKRAGEAALIAEAMGLLERLLQAAEAGGRTGSAIEILILQALAYQAQGNSRPALVPLERALTLAEPEGYVRIFVDEGSSMVELLSAAAVQEMMPGYIGKLLAAFEPVTNDRDAQQPANAERPLPVSAAVSSSAVGQGGNSALIEPLSERELEVLQLIAQGLSNRAISERLFLALSTVKGHNRVIFGKLQVQRRTEAVARAQELGLL